MDITGICQGMFAAEIVDGPYKGWPLGGAYAIESGVPCAEVRAAIAAQLDAEAARIEEAKRKLAALPDVPMPREAPSAGA